MKPFSRDLRERVLAKLDAGKSPKDVAVLFEVSPSWVRRLRQRRRELGTIDPLPRRYGVPSQITAAHHQQFRRVLTQKPDATLAELKAAAGLNLHVGQICRVLQKLELGIKKKVLHASEQGRPDVAAARALWHRTLAEVDLFRLVFLDESFARTNMVRLYGRAPRGMRVTEKVPHGHWQTYTIVAAVRLTGTLAPVVFDGPIDRPSFTAYVEQALARELQPGDVVIMDNLAAHKAAGVQEAIEAVGARVLYLPPYSPDFNPIECLWSKVKTHLRKIGARTYDSLCDAVAGALSTVTTQDCQGYFSNCGYNT